MTPQLSWPKGWQPWGQMQNANNCTQKLSFSGCFVRQRLHACVRTYTHTHTHTHNVQTRTHACIYMQVARYLCSTLKAIRQLRQGSWREARRGAWPAGKGMDDVVVGAQAFTESQYEPQQRVRGQIRTSAGADAIK